MVTNWFEEKRGPAMGIVFAATGIGGFIFNPFSNWLIENHGWENAYLTLGIIVGICTIPMALFVVRARPSDKGLAPYGAEAGSAAHKEAAASGFTEREAPRYAGYDGMIITGKAERPSMLLISGDAISLVEAGTLWGNGIIGTTAAVRERFGARARSLVIGPAGENLVPFACIMNEAHHAFGRAGLGAVMGSKRLKAIVIEPHTGAAALADPSRMKELVKELTQRIKDYLMSRVLRDFGSPGNLEENVVEVAFLAMSVPGVCGMRLECPVLVTKDGGEMFCKTPLELSVIDV